MNHQVITHDSFEALLSWLGPTRDEGAQKYESIRTRLIRIFIKKGCTDPEDLTDITINRVAEKVSTISADYVGDPANYFVGVARHVFREWLRRKEISTEPSPVEPAFEIELDPARQCLRKCLGRLPDDQRDLVLDYYVDQKRAKIELRQDLAMELGVSANALRLRAHRLRSVLEKCVMECLAT
jgi:RNA polymerase sigma factor (sigma-70 family)